MEYITKLYSNHELEGCIVEYYPHIEHTYTYGGEIVNEKGTVGEDVENEKLIRIPYSECEYTEYVHGWKIMNIYENGMREYKCIEQKYVDVHDGLYVVSKIDYIEPNKFPILSKYYDVCHKYIKTYNDKYIDISYIKEYAEKGLRRMENNDYKIYLKLTFEINPKCQKNLIRHFTSIISLI